MKVHDKLQLYQNTEVETKTFKSIMKSCSSFDDRYKDNSKQFPTWQNNSTQSVMEIKHLETYLHIPVLPHNKNKNRDKNF